MRKEFAGDLKFIKEAGYIDDKLLIFIIYKKYYSEIISLTPEVYNSYINHILTNGFRYTIFIIYKGHKKQYNAINFFKEYFDFILNNPYIKNKDLEYFSNITNKYKENLELYIENASYAYYLDDSTYEDNKLISFYTRYNLLDVADKYHDLLAQNIDDSYEKEEATKIKNYINYYYGQQIYNYLRLNKKLKVDDKDIIKGLIPALMIKVKDILKEQINKSNFNLSNLKTNRDKSVLSQIDEKQSKVYILERIYDICGFNNEQRPLTLDKMKEVSEILGVNLLESAVLIKEMPSYAMYRIDKILEENGVEAVDNPDNSKSYTGFI